MAGCAHGAGDPGSSGPRRTAVRWYALAADGNPVPAGRCLPGHGSFAFRRDRMGMMTAKIMLERTGTHVIRVSLTADVQINGNLGALANRARRCRAGRSLGGGRRRSRQ